MMVAAATAQGLQGKEYGPVELAVDALRKRSSVTVKILVIIVNKQIRNVNIDLKKREDHQRDVLLEVVSSNSKEFYFHPP